MDILTIFTGFERCKDDDDSFDDIKRSIHNTDDAIDNIANEIDILDDMIDEIPDTTPEIIDKKTSLKKQFKDIRHEIQRTREVNFDAFEYIPEGGKDAVVTEQQRALQLEDIKA